MKKNSQRILLLIIGLIFIILSLSLNNYRVLRIILSILGIILLTIQSVIERDKKVLFTFIFIFLFSFIFIGCDYIVSNVFKKVPVIIYDISNVEGATIYSSVGYKVWKCDGENNYIIDRMDKNGYYCSSEDIVGVSVNNIYYDLANYYERYSDTFIRIYGMVREVNKDYLVFSPYQVKDNTIVYDDTFYINIYFNMLSNEDYKIGDVLDVIGKVNEFKSDNGVITINIFDSIIKYIENSDYEIKASIKDSCEIDKSEYFSLNGVNYYTSCINSININYKDRVVDLKDALESGLITMDSFYEHATSFDYNNSKFIFNYDNFSVLECDSNNIIIGTNLSIDSSYCNIDDEYYGV